MNLADTDIVKVVSLICTSVLGLECIPAAELSTALPMAMTACVQITGSWQGAVVLACPENFAAHAAAVMFNLPADDRNPTDMQDAIAELTNMIGGNIKGLLQVNEACHLSLPAVVAGPAYAARVPGSRLLKQVLLDCDGQTIVVYVLEKVAESEAA